MENKKKTKKAPEQSGGGFNLWGIGIYLCLAVVIISLIFASCNGGAVYNPDDDEGTPTPPVSNVTNVSDTQIPEENLPVEGTSPSPDTGTQQPQE